MRSFLVLFLFWPGVVIAQSASEVALAKHILLQVQPKSIAENREYCGYIGYRDDGQLVATSGRRGRSTQCTPRWPRGIEVVASWHTHAAFDIDTLSETPSVNDMEADADEGIDGYVATPGGRVWFVDTNGMVTRQLCGLRCLPSDPAFVRGAEGVIAQSYSYRDLIRREAE